MKSRTMLALDWLAKNKNSNPNQAALKFGLTPACVYAAIKRRQDKPVCKCCGQVIRRSHA